MARRKNRQVVHRPVQSSVPSASFLVRYRVWLPVALFALLSLTYFNQVVLTDHVILGSDSGQDLYQGAGLSLKEKLATFIQPMWDERMGGFPSSEEIRPQYFPLYVIYLFTTYQRYLSWRYIFTAFFAAWGMYCMVRQLRLGRLVATWAGVAYMSAPTFLSFTLAGHYAKMGVIALFPWMVMLLFRGMETRRLLHFGLLGGTIGIAAYAPHPQMLYHALLALGIIFLYLLVDGHVRDRDWGRTGTRAALFSLAAVMGLAIGAEGIFPLYHYTRTQSKRAATSLEGPAATAVQLERARSWSLHPEEVASLLIPQFGGYTDQTHGRDYYWGRNAFKINSEYFGVLAVLLALVGLADPQRRRLAIFFAGLFVLVVAYSLGGHTPVHTLAFYLLPGARVMRAVGMVAFIFAFSALLLAAMGLHAVLFPPASQHAADLLKRRLLICGGTVVAVALLTALAPEMVTRLWIAVFYSGIAPQKQAVLHSGYSWLSKGALWVAVIAAAGTLLLYLRLQQRLGALWVVGGLCLLTVVDTWRIDRDFLRYADPARYGNIRNENRDVIRFLKRDGHRFRIFPIPDYRMLEAPGYHLYGIPTVTGFHDFTIARYDRLLREMEPVVRQLEARYYQGRSIALTDSELVGSIAPLLDLVNARYLVGPKGAALHSSRFPLVYTGSRLQVYENPRALPYFYLVPSFRVARDEDTALAWLETGQADPHQEAVLESHPAFASAAGGSVSGGDSLLVEDCDMKRGHVGLRVNCGQRRILLISQNFHPNWHARVDGAPAEVLRADFVWQAVPLAPGPHRVDLIYRSQIVVWSRVAGALGVLMLLCIMLWERWWRASTLR